MGTEKINELIRVRKYYEAIKAKKAKEEEAKREAEIQAERELNILVKTTAIKKWKGEIDRIVNSGENVSRLEPVYLTGSEMGVRGLINSSLYHYPKWNPCQLAELVEYAEKFGYKTYEEDQLKCFLIKKTALGSIN